MALVQSSYIVEDQRQMSAARNYFAWQAALVTPALGRRVVEVGCGIGNFTAFLLDRELVVALDPEADCLAELQQRFPGRRNLHPICGEATDLRRLASFRPDSCVCLNVLEHVSDDRAALCEMASILPAGGKIALLLPAFPALFGPLDHNLGHYRRYRRASVAALAKDAGLLVEKLRYMNLPGFFGWWINSHILKRELQSPLQIRVFDRCFVPVISRLEKIAPPPVGQSVFAVLAKP